MPDFSYKAINQNGDNVAGVVTADSVEMATAILSNQGFIPSKVVERTAGSSFMQLADLKSRFATVKNEELILFTKQFRTMLHAGLQVVQVLEILEHQSQNPKLRSILNSINIDIREGEALAQAFGKQKDIFPPLYINMLRAGETSGTLPDVLKRLSYILEHEHKVKSDISSALQYPKMVVMALGGAFFVLLTFVIPKFESIFMNAGITLPVPTKICIALNYFIREYWFIIFGVVTAVVVGYKYYMKTEQGRLLRDSIILKVPLLGPLFQKAAMSRFASIFAILQASGIQVLSALQILSGTIGNDAIAKQFDMIKDKVQEGRGISGPLRSAKYFTPMVVDMIAIGEETGQLDEMLNEVATHYDDEVEYAVKKLSDNIGPLLIVGLAAVVGFFALSVFLPMWDITKMVQ